MLPIGEVAERSGIAASAIRYYERERLIPKGMQVQGCRTYDEDILDRLALIGVAKAAGLSIAEVRTLFAGLEDGQARGKHWHDLISRKLDELKQRGACVDRMQRALQVLADSDAPTLAECAREIQG